MTSQISFQFNPSFYKKTNPAIIKKCVAKTIKDTTLEAKKDAKKKHHTKQVTYEEVTVPNILQMKVQFITVPTMQYM